MVVALLLAYFTLARQSNLVLTSPNVNDCPHVLRFKDVQIVQDALLVTIKSTKMHYATACPVVFRLPAIPSSSCCPIIAWSKYIRTMSLTPDSMALLLLNGSPLSAKTLLRTLKLVSF